MLQCRRLGIDLLSQEGTTAVHCANMSEEPGNLRVLKALLDAGASPDIKDEEEATPLALVTVWS